MKNLNQNIESILKTQRIAWNYGHDNYGVAIDVKSAMLNLLKYFKHLNSAQSKLLTELDQDSTLKYGKKLCSKANKQIRHYIVTLK